MPAAPVSPPCPKRMVYGPCGGVRPDGRCEVQDDPCTFLTGDLPTWSGPDHPPVSAPARQADRPVVVTDLHVRPRDLASLRSVAARLHGTCDAVLVGDHGARRNDFSPAFTAAALIDAGIRPWVTLACRDRNRVALGAECAALAELGVAGVHCVTGDWEGLDGGIGETKVFDLDALRLVDLARSYGLTVSVAAAPAAPPTDRRAARLVEKARAGAQVCFVNHAGGPGPVGRFVDEARGLGADLAYLPCVPVVTDAASMAALRALPGLALDEDAARAGAGEDTGAGVALAVEQARAMLAIDGVVGVNLSGTASSASELASAEAMAGLGSRIRALGAVRS